MIKDGDLDVEYVRSGDNPAEVMTKNSKDVLYVKHVASMKNGVLVLGTRKREDVVAFAEVVRRRTRCDGQTEYDGWTRYDGLTRCDGRTHEYSCVFLDWHSHQYSQAG